MDHFRYSPEVTSTPRAQPHGIYPLLRCQHASFPRGSPGLHTVVPEESVPVLSLTQNAMVWMMH